MVLEAPAEKVYCIVHLITLARAKLHRQSEVNLAALCLGLLHRVEVE